MDKSPDIDEDKLVKLEWSFIPFLVGINSQRRPFAIYRKLAKEPASFAFIISQAFRPKNSEVIEEAVNEEMAKCVRELLEEWNYLPGTKHDGTIDTEVLKKWIVEARHLCQEMGRSEIADDRIGLLLSNAKPIDKEEALPEFVCEIIDEMGTDSLESGFIVGVQNNRGVTCRAPDSGGSLEYHLAEKYRKNAQAIRMKWPRTSAVLIRIAEYYDYIGKRYDLDNKLSDLEY